MTTVRAENLNMSEAVKVISSAQKFLLPIPELSDGEPLVYPVGTKNKEGVTLDGQPIADWQGKPIGNSGVVFFNAKDQAVQAVKGDGTGVIIINEVTESQAAVLTAKVEELAGTPEGLNLSQLKAVLQTATSLGLKDMYNSDRAFVQNKMTPVGDLGAQDFGLHKRDDRDICLAVRLEGQGQFIGPAATPQQFENGAVIVQQGGAFRLVQSDIFERTYRLADNSPVNSSSLPVGANKEQTDANTTNAPSANPS